MLACIELNGQCSILLMPAKLNFHDRTDDRRGWAKDLGISEGALDVYLGSEVVDLHLDTFIWSRVLGYDMCKRHGLGLLNGHFYRQVDLPRVREARLTGGMWSITTNPLRTSAARFEAFKCNVTRLRAELARASDDVAVVRNRAEYGAASALGKHAAMLAVQGGNALDLGPQAWSALDGGWITRVTLVHMSQSRFGTSSRAIGNVQAGLTGLGREFVRELNRRRILVDLAHISKRGFADAAAVHDPTLPMIVTHSGVDGVYPCWRNLDDGQLRTIAKSGGVIGVVFHSGYLSKTKFGLGRGRASDIAAHIDHIVRTVGEDFAAIGSDFDGMIVPPSDLKSCLQMPVLVQAMLDRGLSETAISKVLGGNFLRVFAAMRG